VAKSGEFVVALDQGSSSSRALAVDSRGRLAALSRRPIRTIRRGPLVEHDGMDIARSVEGCLDDVLARLGPSAGVAALGVTAQRSTVVLWDARTGGCVGPAPSWQDGRAEALAASMASRQAEVHERTGLYLTPYYSAPKIRCLLDSSARVSDLASSGRLRIGPVSTWLLWRLTRGEVFAADPTFAQRMLLLDIRTMDWDPWLLDLFGIPRECLPSLRSSTGDWGSFRRMGRLIAVRSVIGDQQAAAVGQGACEAGAGALNFGTGAFCLLHTGTAAHRLPGILTSVALRRSGRAPEFFLEGTVHAAGTAFEWMAENLGLLDGVRSAERLCRASRERVWALQALGGLGAPRWDYRTPTVFFGLGPRTRKADLVRGAAESIAFLVADIVAVFRSSGIEPSSFKASGGLAGLDFLLQFQADLLEKPVARLRESEATAFGAAFLCAEAAGLPWAGRLLRAAASKTFHPRMSGEESRGLRTVWAAFVKAQQAAAEQMRRAGGI
jgi:glycerol kinase